MTLVPLVPLSPRHLSDVRSPAERAREEQAFYEEHANAWKIALGGQVNSGPMSYSVNGKQYVTVAAGNAVFAFALRQ